MATKCLSLMKGRRIRLTQLDGCGRPIYGEGSQAVSKGFISVALTANTADSDEINVTNAAGEVCIFEPSVTSLTGYGAEITFCEVDPELFALASSQDPYVVNGDAIGFTVNVNQDVKNAFALELWADAAGGDACATDGAEGNFGYLLLPYLFGGIIGDFTVENAAVTFTITGANTRNGNAWGVGPYDDIISVAGAPGPLPTALLPNDHLLTILTNQAPPDPYCGTRPLLDPSVEELTAIAAAVASKTATFTPTPADITAPVYYEFGDGEWDYLAASAMGATTHDYANAGVYTARASSNGTWVSTTVTIL
jgi:hypothetical protein